MLQGEDSAILLTLIKLPFVIKIFVLPIFEWLFYTGFTVYGLVPERQILMKQPLSNRPKIGFQDQLLLNAGQ